MSMSIESRVYRLQSIGGSIYVALPKEWIRRFGLDKGSLVEISIDPDGALRIAPLDVKSKESRKILRISIEVSNPSAVIPVVLSHYLYGFDVIELKFPSSISTEVRKSIENIRRLLLGLEVVEEGGGSMVLQIFSSDETSIENLIRSMGRLARTMYYDVLRGLSRGSIEDLRVVELKENDLDRLYFYTVRTIRRNVMSSPTLTTSKQILRYIDLRIAAKIIEEIGDHAEKAARYGIRLLELGNSIAFLDRLQICMDDIDNVFRSSIEILTSFEKQSLSQAKEELVELAVKGSGCVNMLRQSIEASSTPLHIGIASAYEGIAIGVYDLLSLIPLTVDIASSP
ncbi:phosphate uptake regulator, PhoU [Ignisphaera aggregans DSM 17230]|uniref:Phosphate uptake regulator, PhoU n=1 Tax=Ignisphaera aggregans (strain DSM 17230 / JCM 13409 / AQ1.S1) TaxID=583356 RepID=E0SQ19_IGNAA|nr:phosphate uptake regulator, PhoU [Ignisphaera aggregans DSM 17230]